MDMRPIATEEPRYTEYILVSGSIYYMAKAQLGSQLTDPVWRVCKWDLTGPLVKTWADGDDKFDNQANDLASLTYL